MVGKKVDVSIPTTTNHPIQIKMLRIDPQNPFHIWAIVTTIVLVLFNIFLEDQYHVLDPDVLNTTIVSNDCVEDIICSCDECDIDMIACQDVLYSDSQNGTCCYNQHNIACGLEKYPTICQTVIGACYLAQVEWSVYVNGIWKSGEVSRVEEKDCQADVSCNDWIDKWTNGKMYIHLNWLINEKIRISELDDPPFDNVEQVAYNLLVACMTGIILLGILLLWDLLEPYTTKARTIPITVTPLDGFEHRPYSGPLEPCIICQDNMVPGHHVAHGRICQHQFHSHCLRNWQNDHRHGNGKACPSCEMEV